MTDELFRQNSHLQQCNFLVMGLHVLPNGSIAVEQDRTVFYLLGE